MKDKCPACGQPVRVYKRAIRPNMVYALRRLYDKFCPTGEAKVVDIDQRKNVVADFEKLRYWELIEEGAFPGKWKITMYGIWFLQGKLRVNKYVWIYKGDQVPKPMTESDPPLVCLKDIVPLVVCAESALKDSMPCGKHLEEQTLGLFKKEDY